MCNKSIRKSIVCMHLDALQRITSKKAHLLNVTGEYDFDCWQMYKRSEMMNILIDTCTRNQEYRNDSLFITDCLLIKEWASVLAVYSTSGKTLSDLPTARATDCDPRQEWSMLSNSSVISPNDRCLSPKIEFLSECSLSLVKQENQTWNQTASSWYQIKQEIVKHKSNQIRSDSNPTKKPKKFDCCTIL